jgi:hypothetical protein
MIERIGSAKPIRSFIRSDPLSKSICVAGADSLGQLVERIGSANLFLNSKFTGKDRLPVGSTRDGMG